MKQKLLKWVATLLACASVFAFATACADNGSSLFSDSTISEDEYNATATKGLKYSFSLSDDGMCAQVDGIGTATDTNIRIPSEISGYKVIGIGDSAFIGCKSLKSVKIPNSVKSIGDFAFTDCSNLKTVEIPNSVISVGIFAFADCSGLTIYCEAESEPIGWNDDWNYSNCPVEWDCVNKEWIEGVLYSIKENSATIIDAQIDIITINIPNSITHKGQVYAVTTIGDYAFSECSSLTNITIPNSVNSIGDSAFYNCSSLTNIIIPISVTSIDFYAFYNCSSLTIYCEAGSQPSGWNSRWNTSNCPVVWGYKGEN